ncbi:tyrosine-protein kinase receptor TYRO3-like isoform X2 [Acanthaster planci]|nr:tyrosine-protein kinase receptor TYRO3-like isoform X2 [Acanthaster planci]
MDAVVTCSPQVSGFTSIRWERTNSGFTGPPTDPTRSILEYFPSTNSITYGSTVDPNHYDAQQSSNGGNFSLVVKSVTLDDGAKYWCRFYKFPPFNPEPIGHSIVHIRVPPSMIGITNNGTSYNTGESIPLVADDGHQFTCATSRINPAATFTWNLVLGSSTSQPQGIQTDNVNSMDARLVDSSNLITVDIPESPATGQLMCGATNRQDGMTDTERDITVSLQIKVPPKASSMSISGFSGTEQGSVDQAKQHKIQCLVQGTRPAATIEWYLDSVKQSGTSSDSQPPGQNELIDTTGTWTFTPIRADHNKEVRCEASTPESQRPLTSVLMVPLKVEGPPDTPVITGNTSPMTEGVQIVLTCTADEGYPDDWSLDWSSNGIPISSSTMHSPTSESRYRFSSMVNFTPRRQDNGNNITCTANKASWTTGSVGYLGPIDVQFCARNISVKCPGDVRAGNLASMECLTSESSNPTTTLTWSNGSVSVTGPSDQENTLGEYAGQTSKVTYTTDVLTKYNNKNEFKCCAVNSELSCGGDLCHMCTLNVEYAPEFTSLTQSPNNPVTEGNNVILTCTVDANPMPGDITWEKQGSDRAFNSEYNAGTSTLTLSSITREQAGYYTCTANNGVPTDNPGDDVVSSQLTVIVHYEVNITNKEMTEQGGKDRGSASLICIAEGNPRPTMQWYGLDNTVITNETDTAKFMVVNVTTGGDGVYGFQVTSTLTINNIDSDMDFGTYTCTSTNGVGEADMLRVNLTETRRPDKPIRVMITGQTAESLTVTWTAGYNGGEEQSFRVSYLKTLDSTETGVGESETGGKTTYTVTGLEDYTEYEIRVYARNDIGENTDYAKVAGHTLPKPPGPDTVTVEYDKDDGTVKVNWLKVVENGCIQLEVKYEGNDSWQECGKCIDSDQTVTLSEWCAVSQTRRRRAVGDIEDVLSKLCIDGLCSEAAPAKQAESTTSVPKQSTSNTGIIVGVIVAVVVLSIVIVLGVYTKRKFKLRSHREEDNETHCTAKKICQESSIPQVPRYKDAQSPYQEITELDVIGQQDNQNQGAATYSNVTMVKKRFPRNQLKIVKELGHGAFGLVLLAEATGIMESSNVTLVAVKTLKDSASKCDKDGILKELDLMKKLPDHCNVVRLLGFCIDEDPPYIIMEYLSRGNLKDLLQDSRSKGGRVYGNLHGISKSLTSKDLMKFAKDVADGMAFVSSQKCIHRDLAARNVLLAEDMLCKVSDFGLARDVMNIRVYERGSEGALPMRWMALESLLDDVYTTESDVWSFGVLLWEIVTLGARPYPAMTAKVMVAELQSGYRMPKPQHCQHDLYEMMLRCWDEDPENRPTFKMISEQLEGLINKGKEYISVKNFQESIYEVVQPEDKGEKV